MENAPDNQKSSTGETVAARGPGGLDRPSKRYTLTAYSDAYRLDRDEYMNQPTIPKDSSVYAQYMQEPPARELLDELSVPAIEPLTKADNRGGTIGKSRAGLTGLALAIRGDSSFFAHAYRFTIVLMFGVMIQLPPFAWLVLCLSGTLVVISELYNSAIDSIVRATKIDDAHATAARDIGSASVLVSVSIGVAITVAVFAIRLLEIFAE